MNRVEYGLAGAPSTHGVGKSRLGSLPCVCFHFKSLKNSMKSVGRMLTDY